MTNKDIPSSANTVLVLGGTGRTGRRIASRLSALGVPVRLGSRRADIPFDWTDRSTWGAALAGIDALYIAYQPDLAVPGAPADIKALTALAAVQGVRRVVLLSGRGESGALECEEIVRNSGLPWTIVRCSWFAQNFSECGFSDYLLADEVALPAGNAPEPFVHVDDIAEVAVLALTGQGHAGQVYELTGPRALTFAAAVAEIAAATGRAFTFVPISRMDFIAALSTFEVPCDEISLLDYLFGTVLDGRNSHPTDGVARVLGRPPRDFAEYARDVAISGVWSVTPRA